MTDELPCRDVLGIELTLFVDARAWCPTAFETAGFADEIAMLLKDCPGYPEACVVLPAPPVLLGVERPQYADGLVSAMAGMANYHEALSAWSGEVAQWLRESLAAIQTAIAHTQREGEFLRKTIAESSFGDTWHISSCDQHANTVRVDGRDLAVRVAEPRGTSADMATFHLGPLFKDLWRASWRPTLHLEAADYGTKRIKVSVGRGTRRKSHWIDLGTQAFVKPPRGRAGR